MAWDFATNNGSESFSFANPFQADGTDLTFAFWVNIQTTPTSFFFLMSIYGGAGGGGELERSVAVIVDPGIVSTNNEFYINRNFSAGNMQRGTTGDQAAGGGGWKHVAVRLAASTTASNSAIYVNGTEPGYDASFNGSGTEDVSLTGVWRINGRSDSAVAGIDCLMCEAAVWDRLLSAEEIAALANYYSPEFFNPRAYCDMMEHPSTVFDRMRAQNGTTRGSPVATRHLPIIYPKRVAYHFLNLGTTASFSVDAEAGSYSISGQDAGLELGAAVDAESGSYSVSGQDANLEHAALVGAEAGSYVVTGSDAGALFSAAVAAESGSYVIVGSDASTLLSAIVTADVGSYSIGGQDAALSLSAVLAAESGLYGISGADADLRYSILIDAEAGSYAYTGTDAGMRHDASLVAEAGSYVISGTDAVLARQISLIAEVKRESSYEITGSDAALESSFSVSADAGSYSISGQDATLTYVALAPGNVYPSTAESVSASWTSAAVSKAWTPDIITSAWIVTVT